MTDIEQMEGTLTAFNGFQFDGGGFNYLEGRRILGLAMGELRRRTDLRSELGIAPQHPGRGAVKEDDDVWDVLVFAGFAEVKNFTKNPHLSLGIGWTDVSAMLTLPNKARAPHRRALIGLDKEDFCCKVDTLLENMRPLLSGCPGAEPRLRVRQRHGKRGAPLLRDAYIDIDLRTRSGDEESRVKPQPEWIGAAFDALKNKRKESNLELQIGARFPYRTCQAIQQPEALDFAAAAWIACKPYIEAICESRGAGNQG